MGTQSTWVDKRNYIKVILFYFIKNKEKLILKELIPFALWVNERINLIRISNK